MPFIVFLIVALESLAKMLAVLIFVTAFGWLAWFAHKVGEKFRARLFIALASAPFLLFFAASLWADIPARIRAYEVASLARAPIPNPHPRTLETYGLDDRHIAMLLGAGIFDAVYGGSDGQRRQAGDPMWQARLDPACRAKAQSSLQHLLTTQRDDLSVGFWNCVRREPRASPASNPDAMIFLGEGATTLHPREMPNDYRNYEIRLRTGGREELLDYWEYPQIKRPLSPFLPFSQEVSAKDRRAVPIDPLMFLLRAMRQEGVPKAS